MALITTDTPLYHRRLVREIRQRMRAGKGVFTEVKGLEKRVHDIRLANGRVSILVYHAGGGYRYDATNATFHDDCGNDIVASREA